MTVLYFPKSESESKLMPVAFMVAGVRSGCGKTTVMLSLLAALQRKGFKIQTFKAGPDFIDPMYHAFITNKISYNLDTWMGEYGLMEKVFARAISEIYAERKSAGFKINRLNQIIMVEGTMGLFDGAISKDHTYASLGSSARLAQRLDLPILLVVDAKGLAQSIAAIVHGFLSYNPNLKFLGIVCTHVGSAKHALMLKRALDQFDVPLLGLLPSEDAPSLPSRHLGLVMPNEIDLKVNDLADYMEKHFDFEQFLDIILNYHLNFNEKDPDSLKLQQINTEIRNSHLNSNQSSDIQSNHTKTNTSKTNNLPLFNIQIDNTKQSSKAMHSLDINNKARIAIAKDNAFCFLYPDFPEILSELNADIVYFSPLHDQKIPDNCQALYLPGGYPELYAYELSCNTTMLNSIHDFALNNGTIYAECGGYMYLMQEIISQDASYKMCSCLPCSCQLQNKRVALGYRSVSPYNDSFWGISDLEVRGHEFHYAKIIQQEKITPLWKVKDASGEILTDQGMQLGRVAASWIHLYPESARALFINFIQNLKTKNNCVI